MGFGIRNEKNWHDVLVVSAASYSIEISIVGFYPSDHKYEILEERSAVTLITHQSSMST